nr:unnamed protein product [Digitaria exilis]
MGPLHLPANMDQAHLLCRCARASPPTNHHHRLTKVDLICGVSKEGTTPLVPTSHVHSGLGSHPREPRAGVTWCLAMVPPPPLIEHRLRPRLSLPPPPRARPPASPATPPRPAAPDWARFARAARLGIPRRAFAARATVSSDETVVPRWQSIDALLAVNFRGNKDAGTSELMDGLPGDEGRSQTQPSDPNWPSHLDHKFQSLSMTKQEKNLDSASSTLDCREAGRSLQATQTLWSTGSLSGPIPNGFYSIIPEKRLKECFDTIPSPDDLYSLGIEGFKAEIILVDIERDKKVSALKQLCTALVKGLNSNPAAIIKKVAGLVSDFYKRSNPHLSPARTSSEDLSHFLENRGVQLLGQIRHGSCRPRALLFKVLADSVGIDSKLLVASARGAPGSGAVPSAAGQVASAAGGGGLGMPPAPTPDPCLHPLRLRRPPRRWASILCFECCSRLKWQEQDDINRSFKVPSLRNIMLKSTNSMEGKMRCSSHSDPNVANAFCGRNPKKVVDEHQRTASSRFSF